MNLIYKTSFPCQLHFHVNDTRDDLTHGNLVDRKRNNMRDGTLTSTTRRKIDRQLSHLVARVPYRHMTVTALKKIPKPILSVV
jgi:hypothetical protein